MNIIDSGSDSEKEKGPLSPIASLIDEFPGLREEIECIAIGIGPGSYTGIRMAIAIAQGWQLARAIKTIGISTVEVLVEQARVSGISGSVHVVIDAQRGEFYLATYDVTASGWTESEKLRLASLEDVKSRSASDGVIIGPEVDRWFPEGRVVRPDAVVLARLAAKRNSFIAADSLEPIYLRETSFVKAPPPRIVP